MRRGRRRTSRPRRLGRSPGPSRQSGTAASSCRASSNRRPCRHHRRHRRRPKWCRMPPVWGWFNRGVITGGVVTSLRPTPIKSCFWKLTRFAVLLSKFQKLEIIGNKHDLLSFFGVLGFGCFWKFWVLGFLGFWGFALMNGQWCMKNGQKRARAVNRGRMHMYTQYGL